MFAASRFTICGIIAINFTGDGISFSPYNILIPLASVCSVIATILSKKFFIVKFAEPLFACIFGALLLGEDIFKLQYLIAFILIVAGITLGNYSNEKRSCHIENQTKSD